MTWPPRVLGLIASSRLAALALLPALVLTATGQDNGPIERRAREVAALVKKGPEWADDLFAPAFLKQVPAAQLTPIFEQFHDALGKVVDVQLTESRGEFAGVWELIGAKDTVAPMTLTVDSRPPHSIIALFFGPPGPMTKDLAAAARELGKLSGSVSFGVWKLGGNEPELLAGHEPDLPLAIGSAFKLYVLGALAKEVADGTRNLDEVVKLEEKWRSLPSGQLQSWPIGTPVTLQTLASMMISISDNTATDHLLFALGREKVEAMLGAMGNAHAEKSIPFLSTAEMFRLKTTDGAKGADEFAKLSVAKKRAALDKMRALAPLDLETTDLSAFATPCHIADVEWFASASDLCRAMDWLRRATESGPAAPLRGVLAIDPGVSLSKEAFPYVGYKGGSETGVLNLTFLLRAKDGTWYAASAGWNDPKDAVEDAKLLGLVQRALYLVGKGAEKKPGK